MTMPATDDRPGLVVRIARHWPALGTYLGFSILWCLGLHASLIAGLWLRTGLKFLTIPELLILFTLGGFLAGGPALWLASWLSGRGGGLRRFLTVFIVLGLGTFAATSGLFALEYRAYYAQWHEAVGSRIWFFQFMFTSASAVYQFAIFCLTTGLGAILPLILASLWFARRPH